MSVHIEVGEGQDLEQALHALRQRVQKEYGRPWYKHRYGYYESRGALRRKQRRSKERQTSRRSFYIGPKELFARTGPLMSTGK